MSDEKRQQLIAEGRLNPDGSRKQRCPTCNTAVGEVLTQEAYDAVTSVPGSAVGEVETHALDSVTPALGQEAPQ